MRYFARRCDNAIRVDPGLQEILSKSQYTPLLTVQQLAATVGEIQSNAELGGLGFLIGSQQQLYNHLHLKLRRLNMQDMHRGERSFAKTADRIRL